MAIFYLLKQDYSLATANIAPVPAAPALPRFLFFAPLHVLPLLLLFIPIPIPITATGQGVLLPNCLLRPLLLPYHFLLLVPLPASRSSLTAPQDNEVAFIQQKCVELHLFASSRQFELGRSLNPNPKPLH